METHKNFSSVCIHSNECHYVFVTLLSSLRSCVSGVGLRTMNKFSSIVPRMRSGKFPASRVTLKLEFSFQFVLKRKSCENSSSSLIHRENVEDFPVLIEKLFGKAGNFGCYFVGYKFPWSNKMGEDIFL